MADNEDGGPLSTLIIILLLISSVLLGYYLVARGPKNTGVISVVPQDQVPAGAIPKEEPGEVRGAEVGELCAVRPGPYGTCGVFLGVYFTGERCQRVRGCGLDGDRPPFFSLTECRTTCEQPAAPEVEGQPGS